MNSVIIPVRPLMRKQEPLFEMAFSLTFDRSSPISGVHEAVPKVPPDPSLCGQRGHERDSKQGRFHIGDGEALHDRHRSSTAPQTGLFSSHVKWPLWGLSDTFQLQVPNKLTEKCVYSRDVIKCIWNETRTWLGLVQTGSQNPIQFEKEPDLNPIYLQSEHNLREAIYLLTSNRPVRFLPAITAM